MSLPTIRKYDALETVDLPPIEVFSVGSWNGDEYKLEDLQGMIDAFNEVGFNPPVKAGHADGQQDEKQARIVFGAPALGYIKRIYLSGKKLMAEIGDVPKRFADLIKAGTYRRVSAEIFWQYKNEATGKLWPRVLKAVSFLGADIPALTNLKAIEALFNKNAEGLLYAKDGNSNEFRLYEHDYQQFVPFGPVTDFLLTSRRKAKADVDFAQSATFGSQCGGCKFYIENLNACTLVEGYIDADDGCMLFDADESEHYSKTEDAHVYSMVKRGSKWCLVAKSTGRTLGCHSTKDGAASQEAAIKASQGKYEGDDMKTIRLSRDEVKEICPSCAESMETKGISALTFSSVESLKTFAFADMKECMSDSGMMKDTPDMAERKKACQGMMEKKMSAIREKIDTYQGGADMTKEELAAEREKMKKELTAELSADFDKKIADAKVEGAKDAETRYAKSIEDQGEKIRKMEAEKRSASIDNWIDSQKRDGKIAPVEEPRMKAFLFSLEDGKTLTYSQDGKDQSMSQAELFKDIVIKRPSLFKVLSKAGDSKHGDEKSYSNAQEEVTEKVTEYQKEHGEKDYAKAMLAVLKSDPDLNERYMRLQQ